MREHAQRQGWTVVDEFIEPGASARTADRPVLKRLMSRCRELPKVDVVLVHKIDRLARNVFDHATIKAYLLKCSVRLASVVENVDDSITGQLVEHILASLAEFYSANLGQETKKGMQALAQRGGWPHRAPLGYRCARDEHGRSVVELDSEKGPLLKNVFERYALGFVSLKRLRMEAADGGLRGATGKPLALSYLRRMLENPFYVGRIRWGGRDYPGRHQPLLDEALFLRVQQVLRARHKNAGDKGKHRFMLRGVAFCAQCGSRMTAERHDRWAYYRCTRHTVSKAFCNARFSNTERTHEQVMLLCRSLHVSAALKASILNEADNVALRRITASRERVNSARMQLVRLQEREMRVGEAYALGDMSPEVYRRLAQKTSGERVALQLVLKAAGADSKAVTGKVRSVLDAAESLRDVHGRLANDEARHKLLRVVFKRISIVEGRITDYALHAPFDRLLHDGGGNTPHLDPRAVTSAIENILEFDEAPLRQILEDSTTHDNKAA